MQHIDQQLLIKRVYWYLAITIPLITLFSIVSILYFDRPISTYFYYMHDGNVPPSAGHQSLYTKVQGLYCEPEDNNTIAHFVAQLGSHATYICYLLILPVFGLYFFQRIKRKDSHLLNCTGAVCKSVAFSFFSVNALKYFFGRTSPLEFGYLSYQLHPPSYYFHFFEIYGHGTSFPSGHMFMFCSVMVSIILYYRKMTVPCVSLTALLFAGLLFFNLHYLSDLVVGSYLGSSLALGLYLMKRQTM